MHGGLLSQCASHLLVMFPTGAWPVVFFSLLACLSILDPNNRFQLLIRGSKGKNKILLYENECSLYVHPGWYNYRDFMIQSCCGWQEWQQVESKFDECEQVVFCVWSVLNQGVCHRTIEIYYAVFMVGGWIDKLVLIDIVHSDTRKK